MRGPRKAVDSFKAVSRDTNAAFSNIVNDQAALFPVLSKFIKLRLRQIIGSQCNSELTVCIEIKEKRLCEKRDAGRIRYIYDENPATGTILLRKISGFRFEFPENPVQKLSNFFLLNQRVERLMRE